MKEIQSIKNLHRQQISCIKFTPDGSKLVTASSDHSLKVIDVRTSEVLQTLEDSEMMLKASVFRFCISPNSKYCVVGGSSGTIFIYNLVTGQLEDAYDEEHNVGVLGCDWAAGTESTVCTLDMSGLLFLWN